MRPYMDVRAVRVQRNTGMTTPGVMLALAALILVGGATCAYAARTAWHQPKPATALVAFHSHAGAPAGATPATPKVVPPGGVPRGSGVIHLDVASYDLNVLRGQTAHVNGRVRPTEAGVTVALQVFRRGHWRPVARTVTGAHGRFDLHFAPKAIGTLPVRLRVPRMRRVLPANTDCATLSCATPLGAAIATGAQVRRLGTLNVFRLALASWYGGGGSLACGGSLTSSTMGVANKTLPCGTLVTLRYGGRTVRVPVVDRGPYVAGREFDLTEATSRALGFSGVGVIWSTA